MNEEILKEMVKAEIPPLNDILEWFLQYFKKHQAHHQRSLEAFASYFISFIRAQTEDSSQIAPPRCDTPRKVSAGNVLQCNPSAQLRKLSISDGSCYPTSGIPGDATPTVEGHPINRASELDTTGTPEHLIARQLFDQHGGLPGVCETNRKSTTDFRILENLAPDDSELKGATGYSTPKRFPPQSGAADGPFTPGINENQALSRCRNTNETVYATPPRSNNVSRSSAGNMLLSFTSTPIAGSRGKTTAQHGSSRNGSLEVSCPSPNTLGNGSQRQDASGLSDGSGRRSKTSLPCLGDYIVAQTTKPHRNRRSPFAGNNSGGNNEPTGLNSPSVLKSPMFLDDEFPQLNVTPNKDPQTPVGDDGLNVRKRVSLNTKTSFNESLDGALPGGSSGKKSGTQRRRIAPTTVSRTVSGRHDFNSSSFRSENNLISIESHEDASHDPRGMLRHLKDEIRSDFLQAEKAEMQRNVRAKQSLHSSFNHSEKLHPSLDGVTDKIDDLVPMDDKKEEKDVSTMILVIEFDKVTQKLIIDRLVTIYALLMDLNLVPNMLNELAYLINLVSTERYIVSQRNPETTSAVTDNNASTELFNVLRSPHNCVYFATEVLYHQRTLLALLDCTSLRVVVENEHLGVLHPTLSGFLRDMLAQKMKLENPFINQASSGGDPLLNNSINNVFYQQENDTKDHFPSSKEFSAFNKQRDLFYAALRVWETEHLNPAWEFEVKLGSKVRAMLDILNHPINMSHLAKLFSAQLIISFNFDNSASELQMALPNIDLTKLSKLRQRLVGPSIFSTQYLFPGSQMFFRDFIVASENHQIFIEQLKAVLIHELLQMNGSTYEIFSICGVENTTRSEYVVRPETIATMRVLAKFIGFIITRPFQYEGGRNTIVENRQIELRNMLLPTFDVQPILLRSVAERKLVITVPWLVQYLSMLDLVTLRLRYYEELFRVLHDIYKATSVCGFATNSDLFAIPTSRFIVRSCLDWLFDQSNIPEEYYNSSEMSSSILKETLTDQPVTNVAVKPTQNSTSNMKPIVFNPLLENILSAACPFLADFRVSVMPSKVEKTVSRTGRYRHITTRYSGVLTQHQSSIANKLATTLEISSASAGHNRSKPSHGNVQQRLVEGFLQSQSQSLRRTVELIVDRSTSAVIKDFQMLFILPEKKAVNDRIGEVKAVELENTKRTIENICVEALDRINNAWESHVPKMLNKRITEAFDSLLPVETLDPVRKLCKNITLEKCLQKSGEWRQSYMSITGLFCKDVESESLSLIHKAQHQQQKTLSTNANQTEFSVAENCAIMPSTFYVKLQMLVYHAASSPEQITAGELNEFLAQTYDFLEQPGLTTTPMMDRILAFMLLQLVLLIIKSRCDLSVPELFHRAVKIWKHTKLTRFCLPPPPELDEPPSVESLTPHERSLVDPAEIEQYRRIQMQRDTNYIFSHLVSKRYIRMLEVNATPKPHYELYAEFITVLLQADIITKDLLNEQFVTLFHEDWPQSTLDSVSVVINRVLQKNGPSARHGHSIDDSNTEMFMEMLSDIARDITEF
ncbi:protein disks lost [Anopheles marshallii]|uniref:protein disks lost n=1 Tax=Anopheles marshallii TaxID=1521116 RepID=UPI00237B94EC|nr:protein disks lost [Anopheles marshallii]